MSTLVNLAGLDDTEDKPTFAKVTKAQIELLEEQLGSSWPDFRTWSPEPAVNLPPPPPQPPTFAAVRGLEHPLSNAERHEIARAHGKRLHSLGEQEVLMLAPRTPSYPSSSCGTAN